MQTLSVIIITKNEAKNIQACLESVKWANEIIVLDSGSTDDTVALCKAYTSKIFQTDWPGYGKQKNRALDLATCQWVLSIDADEIVTPELQHDIQQLLQALPQHAAYSILRISKYCRKYLRYGDWRNDNCVRLFKKNCARFKDVAVHEDLIVEGSVGQLNAILLHNSFDNLEQVLSKVNEYSTLGAQMYLERQKTSSLSKAILRGFWTFLRSYIFKLGFLDGREGFIMAVSNAEGCYYRYLKLFYLQKSNTEIKKCDVVDTV